MVTEKLHRIKEMLLNANPVFTDGSVYDPYKDKGGITDTKSNYFYLQVIDASNGDTYRISENDDTGCGGCDVEVDVKLIAKFKGCVKDAGKILATQLKRDCDIEITRIADNAELIYNDEYGETLTKDINLVRIKFQLKTRMDTKCKNQICNEDCC